MSRYLLESVLVALGPLAAASLLAAWYVRRWGWTFRESFLLAWTVPPVLVYTLVHFGQAGYVLTFLPALVIFLWRVLVTALGQAPSACAAPRWADRRVVMLVRPRQRLVLRVRAADPRDFDTPRSPWIRQAQDEFHDWIISRTAAALREHEEVVRDLVDSIRGVYPSDTVIITEQGNSRSYPWFRHAMFYLPEYAGYELQVGGLVPGFWASRLSATMSTIPGCEIDLPRPASGSSGSSTTGARPRCGRRPDRDRDPARPLSSTCCRWAGRPSTTRTTPSCAPPRRAGRALPLGRGPRRWRADGLVVAVFLWPPDRRRVADRRSVPARRFVDPSALRAQPRRRRRIRLQPRHSDRRLDRAAVDAPARRGAFRRSPSLAGQGDRHRRDPGDGLPHALARGA